MKRDVVIIGGSAGSINVLRTLIGALPKTFVAAVYVVVHSRPRERNELVYVLNGDSRLAVMEAKEGAPLDPGRVYVLLRISIC